MVQTGCRGGNEKGTGPRDLGPVGLDGESAKKKSQPMEPIDPQKSDELVATHGIETKVDLGEKLKGVGLQKEKGGGVGKYVNSRKKGWRPGGVRRKK